MPINWDITREDMDLLVQVAKRVERDLNLYPDDRRTLVMDLNACHANGFPLDFSGLLAASLTEFSHDIYGIRNAIDRDTGVLDKDIFTPRYALANRVPVNLELSNEELVRAAHEALSSICANRAGDQRAKERGLGALETLTQRLRPDVPNQHTQTALHEPTTQPKGLLSK
jgi:hypothetical protein